MAVSSLRYRPGAPAPDESKFGYVIFDGRATEYHIWIFRTRLKLSTAKKGEDGKSNVRQVIQNVVENLRGEALQVAMDIGIDTLVQEDGTGGEKLLDAMRKHIFPIAQYEAKELYKEGHKTREGVLTRQSGESMQNFILRRRRWWQLLQQLDNTVKLNDSHLGDLMLDAANIQEFQRQLILTTTNNSTEFDIVADALMVQLGRLHMKDRSSAASSYGSRFYRRGKGKGSYGVAHIAEDPVEEERHYGIEEGLPWIETDEYEEELEEEEETIDVNDEALALQLNLLEEIEETTEGGYPEEEVVADLIQTEMVAHAAWSSLPKGKGKGKGKKGKGKGHRSFAPQGKGKGKFAVRKGSASLEERKRRLQLLKRSTKCHDCGESGHWSGDAVCRKNKGATRPTANKAVLYEDAIYQGDEHKR